MSDSSLSWGHTPPPPRKVTAPRLIAAVLAVIVIVFGAVQVRAALDQPASDKTSLEVAAVLDKWVIALRTHDLDAFRATLDGSRPLFTECQELVFQTYARTGQALPYRFNLGRVDRYKEYVRAFAYWSGGWERIYFRHDDSGWKRSEPLVSEIGDKQTRAYGTTALEFWGIDADIADVVGDAIPAARAFAVAQGGPAPTNDFSVRVTPIEGLGPRCGYSGTASGSAIAGRTLITIRNPLFVAGYEHLADETIRTLEHEALHWVQREYSRDAMTAMPWWMVEGWPTARADKPNSSMIAAAFCDKPSLTWTDLSNGPRSTDGFETVHRYYTLAGGLVDELDRQYPANAYWTVVRAGPVVSKCFP